MRELERSGPTAVPEVRRARDAFFKQPVFRSRHIWDRHLFDDDPETAFGVSRRWGESRVRGGSFRLDLGEPILMDRLVLEVGGDYFLQPMKSEEMTHGSVSADLKRWRPVQFFSHENVEVEIPADEPVRYVRMPRCPDRIAHVRGYFRGRALDRTRWRASNLLATYGSARAARAWSLEFTLAEAASGGYIAIPVDGRHGHELAYAALRVAVSAVVSTPLEEVRRD